MTRTKQLENALEFAIAELREWNSESEAAQELIEILGYDPKVIYEKTKIEL